MLVDDTKHQTLNSVFNLHVRWLVERRRTHLSKKKNTFKEFWIATSYLRAELTEMWWKRDILLRAAAPSVISPLFTTNCDHYSTETASDSITAFAPVETSPFQSLSPESPYGCQNHAVPSDPLRSINILSSSIKGAGNQRPERRTALSVFFFFPRGGIEWDCRSEGEMAQTHVP